MHSTTGLLDVVLLLERVRDLLDGEAGALPLDAVDRAAGREGGSEHEAGDCRGEASRECAHEREWRQPSDELA